jgi:flagellar biosynthesis protein FlhF
MHIKKFSGRNESEALARVRRELGADAVILETHFPARRRWWSLRRERTCEIWAGSGFGIVRDYGPRAGAPAQRAIKAYAQTAAPPPPPAPPAGAIDSARILEEIGDLRTLILQTRERLAQSQIAHLGDELLDEYLGLTSAAVSDTFARELIARLQKQLTEEELHDRRAIREAIKRAVREHVRCADGIALKPGRCVKVAFLGPTGVGKTTTIAKLMSIYAYRGKDVGIITCDTQRIAAAEQIKRVAELVDVPVRVCRLPDEAPRILEEFRSMDVVLIDTAGRGQRNEDKIKELKVMLEALQPDEKHLVLSSNAQRETLVDVLERFCVFDFDKIVLTKLDEAVKSGILLDVLAQVGKELSFITTGQEIPQDIEIADGDRLAGIILGEEVV